MNSSRVTRAVNRIMGALSYTLTTGKEGETDEHGCQAQKEQDRQPDGEVLRFHQRSSLSLHCPQPHAPAVPKQLAGCKGLTSSGLRDPGVARRAPAGVQFA